MSKERFQEEIKKTAALLEICEDEELRREMEVLEILETTPARAFVPFNVRIPTATK